MSEWLPIKGAEITSGVYPACSMHPNRKYDPDGWEDLLYYYDEKDNLWSGAHGGYDHALTHYIPMLPTPPTKQASDE